jgi:alkylation response protein AidB-like acyl-CoA dehydrogenase
MHILYQNSLSMFDIMEFGTEEQKQQAVEHYMETGWPIASLSISEPGAGSDNGSMTCTAVKQEDGTYRLNGQKTWVTMGAKLPYTIVVAKDEDPSRENRNMSLWYINMDREGVSTAPLHKIGQQCIPFCEVYLDNVVVTEEDRMGEPGKGFMMLMKNFEVERAFIVAEQVGLAQAALEDATKYANQRIAFGKPIARQEIIMEYLTDMEIAVQNTRNMLYKTLWQLDNGIPVQLESALLKRYGCSECFKVADKALGIYAGLGYTTEVRIGRIWADLRGNMFGGGTHEIMAYIAGRQVAKKYADN